MELSSFLRGLGVGFAVALPLGPIGLLCVRRTLERGWASGFASGVGAATADALYAVGAAFGLAALFALAAEADVALRLIGGALLVWLALHGLRAPPTGEAARSAAGRGDLLGAWAGTFALTLANPATILSFVAIFGGLGFAAGDAGAGALVAGVFCGSVAWFGLLTGGVALARRRMSPGVARALNRIGAALLLAFGVYGVGSAIAAG